MLVISPGRTDNSFYDLVLYKWENDSDVSEKKNEYKQSKSFKYDIMI